MNKAFKQGQSDFYKGNLQNPFKSFAQVREWDRGFNKAYFSNLKKVKQRELKQGTK